jgi:hypothetical protein
MRPYFGAKLMVGLNCPILGIGLEACLRCKIFSMSVHETTHLSTCPSVESAVACLEYVEKHQDGKEKGIGKSKISFEIKRCRKK